MPFENVDGKNFEQVLLGIEEFVRPVTFLLKHHPSVNGWTWDQHVSALRTMIGAASDKLYASDETHGQQIAAAQAAIDKLRVDLNGLGLIVARLDRR